MNTVDNLRRSPEDIRELAAVWPLCFHFKLPSEANMIVAGAYKGKVIQLLADMYPNYGVIYGFDPQLWALEQAEMRLKGYKDVYLLNYGIGVQGGTFTMGEWETDACSLVNIGENARLHGEGNLAPAEIIFDKFAFTGNGLDLAVFNMEGYEFDLLPHLIEKDLMRHIKRLAVQFHHGFGNDRDWPTTFGALDATHKLVINEMPQWGYWLRRDP